MIRCCVDLKFECALIMSHKTSFYFIFCTKHILRCKCENAVHSSGSPFYDKPCSVWHGPLVSTRCAWSKVPVAKMATRGQQLDVSANNCLTSLLMTAFSGLNEQPNWSGVATVRPTGRLIEASDVRGDECRINEGHRVMAGLPWQPMLSWTPRDKANGWHKTVAYWPSVVLTLLIYI